MAGIKIIADSTSDIPKELIEELGIEIIPVNLVLNGKIYLDGIEMPVEEFYKRYETFKEMYSQPVPYEDYVLKYKQWTNQYDEVVIVHISKHLSDTYNVALRVHDDFKNTHACKVSIIDSKHASLGFGMMVIAAARAARAGRSGAEIVAMVKSMISRTSVYLGVPSLKSLRKSKRISGLKSLMGTAMGVKPVLAINEEGKLEIKSKILGKKRNMMLEMLDQITEEVGGSTIDLGIAHAGAPDLARELREVLEHKFNCRNVYVNMVCPSIGINTGPTSTGIMFHKVT